MPGPTKSNSSSGTATLVVGHEDGQEGDECGLKSEEAGCEAREAVSSASACRDERPPSDSIDAGRTRATDSSSAGQEGALKNGHDVTGIGMFWAPANQGMPPAHTHFSPLTKSHDCAFISDIATGSSATLGDLRASSTRSPQEAAEHSGGHPLVPSHLHVILGIITESEPACFLSMLYVCERVNFTLCCT